MDHLPPEGLMSQNRALRPNEVTACFLGKADQYSEMVLPVTVWGHYSKHLLFIVPSERPSASLRG